MRLHRFIRDIDLSTDELTLRDPDLVSQWRNVLRITEGDTVLICDGNNTEVEAVIETLSRQQAVVRIHKRYTLKAQTPHKVRLYISILKGDHLDMVIEKATEVGVERITPLIAARTIKKQANLDRLHRIALEASEQSGRGTIPIIDEPVRLEAALAQMHEDTQLCMDTQLQAGAVTTKGTVGVWIGPEGGWTDEERELLGAKTTFMTLGPLTLRGETAAIIGSYRAVQGLF